MDEGRELLDSTTTPQILKIEGLLCQPQVQQ